MGALAVVHWDAAGSASSTIALLRFSVSLAVRKFSEIIFNAVQASQPWNSFSITGHINNLAGFEGLPGWGSACESQDDCTEHLYAIVVCSVHVHCYGDQVIFADAKVSDYFDASQATLATSSHGGDSDCFRLQSNRLVS